VDIDPDALGFLRGVVLLATFVRQPGEDPGGRHIAGQMAMIQYDSVHFALALIKLGEGPLGIAPRTEL
jgi:hypothetical protein